MSAPAGTAQRSPAAAETAAIVNASGAGPFLLVCEHGSNAVPGEFDGLGLDPAALASHIAWDPGALPVAEALSELLDAPLVAQRVSRLVYDCNRPPESPAAIPERSEHVTIPGNVGLSEAARRRRVARYYAPFRDLLSGFIDGWRRPGVAGAMVTVHSFTPVYKGVVRDVEIGIVHDDDARLAEPMIACPALNDGLVVRRNEPYGPAHGVTHTLRAQALPRRMLNVMIELRSDLISDRRGQRAMAARLAGCLTGALAAVAAPGAARRAV